MVTKFILTKELGRLSRWLRILGFDSVYFNSPKVSSLKIQALREDRIILTRSHRLKEERRIKTIMLESENLIEQLKQITKQLNLNIETLSMFSRCIVCNRQLEEIKKLDVRDRVPEYVYNIKDEFNICPECRRIYWQGTHWGNVKSLISQIK